MGRTLKDGFKFNKVPTDRKRAENVFYTLCPLLFASTAFAETRTRLFNRRYGLAQLGSIYLPEPNSICFRSIQTRYDINPR